MPSGSPFTQLCQQLGGGRGRGRADLHLHSTFSDGLFSPAEVVRHAIKAGLQAIALTDHDTVAGFRPTREAAAKAGSSIEVIPAVEITCGMEEKELHLLAYFVDPDHPGLLAELERLRQCRYERFLAMVERLRQRGSSIDEGSVRALLATPGTLGRGHLARLLVESGQVRTTHDAFTRHLDHPAITSLPKGRVEIVEAIQLVKNAGGISSWAHPPASTTLEQLSHFCELGLDAVECEYPWAKPAHGKRLRAWTESLGLAVSGGSDCHGPQPNSRAIGSRTIRRTELERLRASIPNPIVKH